MLRCIEQEFCNKSYMHPNQKIKVNYRYMKIDPPMWIAVDFGWMNVLVSDNDNDIDTDNKNNDNTNDSFTDKLFVNKPIAIGFNTV